VEILWVLQRGQRSRVLTTTGVLSLTLSLSHSLTLSFSLSSAQEVKEHSFFRGIDWQHVYLQKVWPQGAETTTSAQPTRLSLLLSGSDP
jgi:hypothetical protein